MTAKENFDNYRFAGLEHRQRADGFLTMNRVALDRVVVRVEKGEAFRTRYGYGLHLDNESVLWLKKWQVSESTAGTEVLILSKYFAPKFWTGNGYGGSQERLFYEYWEERAATDETEVVWVT